MRIFSQQPVRNRLLDMSPKNVKNPLRTVARANFLPFRLNFPSIKKKPSIKSKIKINEYVCQVSTKSLENYDF